MGDLNQPVVLDNGSGVLKAGFAGGESPTVVFPSFVGRPKHKRVMVQTKLESDLFVGRTAEEHRGVLTLTYPLEHGIVTNWNDMEKVWAHVYSKEHLNISSEEHPVLLTEAPLNPRRNREKAAEVFFEQFNAPSLFVSPQATLSLYASGRTTGVVLDSGDGVTHAVPVYEGFTMPHAITRMDVAGRDVTEHLMLLLRRAGHVFHTSAEREVVRCIKEQTCYVAFNPAKEEKLEAEHHNTAQSYKLPDGRIIELGAERFRAPEVLFNPSVLGLEYRQSSRPCASLDSSARNAFALTRRSSSAKGGVHECLADSIFKSDLDIRKTLFTQIVLAGGSTMYAGYGDRLVFAAPSLARAILRLQCPRSLTRSSCRASPRRLLNEVRKLTQKATCGSVKIRISAPPNRKVLTWVGGSILASLATFNTMWVRRAEYEEQGAAIMHQRSL